MACDGTVFGMMNWKVLPKKRSSPPLALYLKIFWAVLSKYTKVVVEVNQPRVEIRSGTTSNTN
jgi:hypothetical protein